MCEDDDVKPTCEDGSMPKGLKIQMININKKINGHHHQALEGAVVREGKARVGEVVDVGVVVDLVESQKKI